MPNSPESLFIRNWNVYRKVVDANYMRHAEIAAEIKIAVAGINKPIHVLDAGCGDAMVTLGMLQGKQIAMYTGIDLSGPALELAAAALQEEYIPYVLEEGAIEERIPAFQGSCDLLHMSFVLHHLTDTLKEQVIHQCASKLNQGGMFILVDVFRLEGQTREAYLDNYMQRLKSWDDLSPDEKTDVEVHIRSFDFPAVYTDMLKWLKAAGFDCRDAGINDKQHYLLCCTKR